MQDTRLFQTVILFSILSFYSCAPRTDALQSRWTQEDGIAIVIDTTYYRIQGATSGDLLAQMKLLGPKDYQSQRYASTEYEISWTYRFKPKGQRCTLGNVGVAIRISLTLPDWNGQDLASDEMKAAWDRFHAAVRKHEEGHRNIALKAAGEVLKKLQSLSGYSNCFDLDGVANYEGKLILSKYQKIQSEFDMQTENGLTQGVHLN
jgi:predicted secreted Zn-dependent protease